MTFQLRGHFCLKMDLQEKFKSNLLSNSLVETGDRIMLAISGGLDSVVLLDLFSKIQEFFRLKLAIIHVHHGIRGDEADVDLEFVRSLSDKYNLPFFSKKVDSLKFAREDRCSLEESARILRYQVYEEILRKTKFNKLATGHTANDQTETILDHLLRGSGILGMTGISKARGPYIRPLLNFSREVLETYVHQHELVYHVDSTNKDLKYRRNRIRMELIPYLKKHFNPNLIKTLNRLGEILEENEQFLKFFADNSFKALVTCRKKDKIILDINVFLSYFIILQKYILIRAFEELAISRNVLDFDKLSSIVKLISNRKIGKRILIDGDCQLLIDHDGIVIKRNLEAFPKIKLNVLKKDSLQFRNYEFKWLVLERQDFKTFDKDPNIEFLDLDQTGSELYIRNFLPGDRFVPLNFTGHKGIADYFSDRKIPHHLREEIPILESNRGIVWVCGYCIDDRFKVSAGSKRILKLEVKEVSNAI